MKSATRAVGGRPAHTREQSGLFLPEAPIHNMELNTDDATLSVV
jgi:hypothetical protein